MNLFYTSLLTRVGVEFGKLWSNASLFIFLMNFVAASYKTVTVAVVISRLGHFVVCMENEPIVERSARFCTALTSAWVLNSKLRVKFLLLSLSHLVVKSGVCERSEVPFPYLACFLLTIHVNPGGCWAARYKFDWWFEFSFGGSSFPAYIYP